MAEDMLALMDEIGVGGRFLVVGHDRGARVARRLAADHPDRLCGAALIDVMPLEWVYEQGPDAHALRYAHWYFHLQRGLAEELIGARPEQYAPTTSRARTSRSTPATSSTTCASSAARRASRPRSPTTARPSTSTAGAG